MINSGACLRVLLMGVRALCIQSSLLFHRVESEAAFWGCCQRILVGRYIGKVYLEPLVIKSVLH